MICSDAVPDFIGDKYVDHVESCSLNIDVIRFCEKTLKPGGGVVMKIIQGPETEEVLEKMALKFKTVQKIKPSASR
jgi:23S rRNA (uridine2552-2'-O)-methyltransferase